MKKKFCRVWGLTDNTGVIQFEACWLRNQLQLQDYLI